MIACSYLGLYKFSLIESPLKIVSSAPGIRVFGEKKPQPKGIKKNKYLDYKYFLYKNGLSETMTPKYTIKDPICDKIH